MSYLSVSKHKRIIAGIMGVLMLFIVLSSVLYIAAEADHDCTGAGCPICACIQQCENTLHQIADGIVLQISIIIPIVFMLVSALLSAFAFPKETLVSRKVRLNN